MDDRLTIGAFGRLTGLTPKALRHYDAIGLLRPDEVDPETGYRRYGRSQVTVGRTIRRLRDLDVPIEDVRAVVDDPTQASKRLRSHAVEVEADLFRRQRNLHRLRNLTEPEEETEPMDTMETTPGGLTREEERQTAVDLFNLTWELLETSPRTAIQDDRMLHAAHASRYHWERVGDTTNLVIGEWQCSRVYAVLGRSEPSEHHARRALTLCDEASIEGFFLAASYEALTRALLVAGDRVGAAEAETSAWRAAEAIDEEEERATFEQDMASLPR
jgi:DNA-binding transcriptional MerR regulator